MHQMILAVAVAGAVSLPGRVSILPTPTIPVDTVGCRAAAVAAVKMWFGAIGTGDIAAVRKAVSPTFIVMSLGRSGWPEPFFRAERMSELFVYVRRRAAQHDRITDISVPLGDWHDGRLMLGAVSYTRTADDVVGKQRWIGKGEYECGKGIYVLNTAPQGKSPS